MSVTRAGSGLAVVALSGLAVLGVQAPASAAAGDCPRGEHYNPSAGCVQNGLSLEHRNMTPGGKNRATTVGFKVGTKVTLLLDGKKTLKTFTSPENTVKTVSFTIPKSTKPGNHTVVASGTAQNRKHTSKSAALKVVRASGNSSSSTVKATRSAAAAPTTDPLAVGAVAGAGLLLLGSGPTAVYVARRRRSQS